MLEKYNYFFLEKEFINLLYGNVIIVRNKIKFDFETRIFKK